MLILVTKSLPNLLSYGPGLGRLFTPRMLSNVQGTVDAGIPWAADNDAFHGFNADPYKVMLDALDNRPNGLFVTLPDVVGDWEKTRQLADEWLWEVQRHRLPIGYVLQDGQPFDEIPWTRIDAVFIGGTTEWKLSFEAASLVAEAKKRELWVHMGRVNSLRRLQYAIAIGVDSVDGSSFSKWSDAYIPRGLRAAAHHQMALKEEADPTSLKGMFPGAEIRPARRLRENS